VDPAAELVAEHVIDEPVPGDQGKAAERRCRNDGVEVMTVPGDLGPTLLEG
jgi:hypothetical protein